MKLTVPAIRIEEPDPAREAANEHTALLLDAIDALLAESMALASVMPMPAAALPVSPSGVAPAFCPRSSHRNSRGPRRPVTPAA
ncbi:MAG TPA: hypothetical protein VME46_09180 [Acidimicrobiales bacterium]|nr:hypothetical protein [Acidimicrobiales bacterium]